ncbi:MAG: hypothetical protein NT047_14125 [Deltaproteobacteria bacterium]|nr:hypothetical protein [Deltaproteobacteria bacterium]
MGNLTDDMTRLRGEIETLRGAREALLQEMARDTRELTTAVSATQAYFAAAHTVMAKKTSEEREAFVAAMIDEVNSLLGEFSRDRNDKARKGRHDREVFLSEMRRQVMDLRKETADDLMGARLAWRGESPGKSRPVPMKKKQVVVKPILPPVEAAPKKTAAAPEIKTEKLPVTFKEPLKKEPVVVKPIPPPVEAARKKTIVAAPEIKAEKPPVKFMEPLKKEEKKKAVAAPEAPAVETPKVKAPPLVSASKPPFLKSKEKSWLDEKPAKAGIRAKRGRK